jgi:hypothetical protein
MFYGEMMFLGMAMKFRKQKFQFRFSIGNTIAFTVIPVRPFPVFAGNFGSEQHEA